MFMKVDINMMKSAWYRIEYAPEMKFIEEIRTYRLLHQFPPILS